MGIQHINFRLPISLRDPIHQDSDFVDPESARRENTLSKDEYRNQRPDTSLALSIKQRQSRFMFPGAKWDTEDRDTFRGMQRIANAEKQHCYDLNDNGINPLPSH